MENKNTIEFEYRGYTHLGVTLYTEKSKKGNWKLFRKERIKSPRGGVVENFLDRDYNPIFGYTTPNFEHTDKPIRQETILPKAAKSVFKQRIERKYKSAYQNMFEQDVAVMREREKALLPTEVTLFISKEFYEFFRKEMVPLELPYFKYNVFSLHLGYGISKKEKYYIGNINRTYGTEYTDPEPYFCGIHGVLSDKQQKIEELKTIGAEILKIRQEIAEYQSLHSRGYGDYGEMVIQDSYDPELILKYI